MRRTVLHPYGPCYILTDYDLISLRIAFIAWVKSYELFLLYELRVTVYCTSYELLLICELRIATNSPSYELLFKWSYYKDKDDKAVHNNKVPIRN